MNSPIDKRDQTDSGDDVLRRFRYQHAYGVILSIGVVTGKIPYIAIWCEQHEDFLAERKDGQFDAYQVKTKKPELGEWELNDDAILKSINRFTILDNNFPGKIHKFNFVSNAQFSNSCAKNREYLSPLKLLSDIKRVSSWQDLGIESQKGFNLIKNNLSLEENSLWVVLKRLNIMVGPTDRSFEEEIAMRHIANLPECKSLDASTLSKIGEALIARIAQASSLVSNDGSRDWTGLIDIADKDPLLMAKRITADDVILTVRDSLSGISTFLPSLASLQLGKFKEKQDKLKRKMSQGGLTPNNYETMRRRAITAERELLDLATRPDGGNAICSQIENVVLTECDDVNLRVSQNEEPFGTIMLIEVQNRLKQIAKDEPTRVYRKSYDTLVGVAGLLSSECKVWWSKPFNMGDES